MIASCSGVVSPAATRAPAAACRSSNTFCLEPPVAMPGATARFSAPPRSDTSAQPPPAATQASAEAAGRRLDADPEAAVSGDERRPGTGRSLLRRHREHPHGRAVRGAQFPLLGQRFGYRDGPRCLLFEPARPVASSKRCTCGGVSRSVQPTRAGRARAGCARRRSRARSASRRRAAGRRPERSTVGRAVQGESATACWLRARTSRAAAWIVGIRRRQEPDAVENRVRVLGDQLAPVLARRGAGIGDREPPARGPVGGAQVEPSVAVDPRGAADVVGLAGTGVSAGVGAPASAPVIQTLSRRAVVIAGRR